MQVPPEAASVSSDNRLIIAGLRGLNPTARHLFLQQLHQGLSNTKLFALTSPKTGPLPSFVTSMAFAIDNAEIFTAWPTLSESWYDSLRPIEGHAMRMMDRDARFSTTLDFNSLDRRRVEFLKLCEGWLQFIEDIQPTHALFVDVPHDARSFVGYHALKVNGTRIALAFHEKSGLATRTSHIARPGDTRPPTSMDVDTYCFKCDGRDPMKILDEQSPWWLRDAPRHLAVSMPTVADKLRALPTAGQRRSASTWRRLRKLYRKRRQRSLIHNVFAFRERVSLWRWRRHLEQHGETPDSRTPFAVYFLAYQPEASTSPRAGLFVEQTVAIGLAARALESRMPLYVREHPDQFSRYRSRVPSLMKFIRNGEGVRVLSSSVSADWCLEHASLILSPPGSIVRQAWLKGVPVVQFGQSGLTGAPGVLGEDYLLDVRSGRAEVPTRSPLSDAQRAKIREFDEVLASERLKGGPLNGKPSSVEASSQLADSLSWAVTTWITRDRQP